MRLDHLLSKEEEVRVLYTVESYVRKVRNDCGERNRTEYGKACFHGRRAVACSISIADATEKTVGFGGAIMDQTN